MYTILFFSSHLIFAHLHFGLWAESCCVTRCSMKTEQHFSFCCCCQDLDTYHDEENYGEEEREEEDRQREHYYSAAPSGWDDPGDSEVPPPYMRTDSDPQDFQQQGPNVNRGDSFVSPAMFV